MPRACSVCGRDDLAQVDEWLVGGVALRDIAKRCTDSASGPVSVSALSRHQQAHLSPALVRVAQEREDERALGLVERLHELLGRVDGILAAAEGSGKPAVALSAVREARSLIESIGRFTGELDERPVTNVVNVLASPEWLEVQQVILRALVPYPEARWAVARALDVDDEDQVPELLP